MAPTSVTIPAGQQSADFTITAVDDTLLVVGNAILVDGDVTGDLLAFGRSVTIRGNVMGNVVSGAETVTVEGTVGGDVVEIGARGEAELRIRGPLGGDPCERVEDLELRRRIEAAVRQIAARLAFTRSKRSDIRKTYISANRIVKPAAWRQLQIPQIPRHVLLRTLLPGAGRHYYG